MNGERTGVAVYTFELLDALFSADSKHDFYLFYNSYTDVSGFIPKWDYKNVHFVEKKWPNKLLNASMHVLGFPKIDLYIKKETGVQLDYFYTPNINFLALSKKIKCILTIHDLSFELFTDCYSKKRQWWHKIVNAKKQCEESDIILCPSLNTKQDIVQEYNIASEKLHVVYPGLPYRFQKEQALEKSVRKKFKLPKHFVFFLGTIEPRKNIVGAIEGFMSRTKIIEAGYEMIIAGPKGWHYQEIIDTIDACPQVRYIGYVAEPEKQILFNLADAFVFPSLYEGFGFPVLEAMHAGTPVLTSNRSSLPEVVGDAAYLAHPLDSNDIGLGLERILDNAELRNDMIEKGKQQAKLFTWQKAASQFLKLL